jgi:hypothetical protein
MGRTAGGLTGLAALGLAAAAAAEVVWRRGRDWDATEEERTAPFPGDELVAGPASSLTRAVTVEAPAEEVWRWLVQIGQGRGGWYSYDALENLLGLDIHSTDEVRPEWQDLAVGDRVVMIRPGWMGLADGFGLPVAVLDPPRALVLREDPDETPWDAVWSFLVVPVGPGRCRLVSRSRAHTAPGIGAALGRAAARPMDLVTLFMTRRMLLGIRDRAEAAF